MFAMLLLAGVAAEPTPHVSTANKLTSKDGDGLTELAKPKVIGGMDLDGVGSHEWLVQMNLVRSARSGSEAYRCGGSLITPNIILTAAHCFFQEDGSPMNYDLTLTRFYIGLVAEADKFLATAPHLVREASCYKTHPDYDFVTHENDIALVYLASPMPSDWPVAALPTDASVLASVAVAGWGATNAPADGVSYTYPDVLQGAALSTMSNVDCHAAGPVFSALVQDSMVCAYHDSRDTCVGDSGGPLYSLVSGAPIVYGITSWGVGCNVVNSPGVYTRVHSFAGWIQSAVTELEAARGCTEGTDGESFGDSSEEAAATVGGCQCSTAWAIGGATCSGVDDIVFRGCNMAIPCDGDTGGVEGQSWCILESSDGCAPAGQNWDYCVPELPETTTSSTTSTEAVTTTTSTEAITTPTTTPTTTTPTTTPTTTAVEPDWSSVLNNLDQYTLVEGTVPGFLHIANQQMCDPILNEKAAISKYPGEHTHEDCTAFCESEYDCYFASIDWKGRCYFFRNCDHRVAKNIGHIYVRTSLPTTPEPSPTEGYTLLATGQICDPATSRFASRSSLGGGGFTIADCAQGCDGSRDCFFFFFTSTGFCKMFAECNSMITHGMADTLSYSRDPYQLETRVERCDKDVRGMISKGGGGHSHEACRQFCDGDVTCAFYVWYSLKGFCHIFTHCGEGMNSPLIEGAHGSMVYSRVNGAKEPVIDDWSLMSTTQRCDKDGAANVKANQFSLGGGGWDPYQCAAGCAAQGNSCTAFTYYPSSGYCHMFELCVDYLDAGVKGCLTYHTAAAERPLKK